MTPKPNRSGKLTSPKFTSIDPQVVKFFAIALVGYYAALAILAALIGREMALWLSAPLSGIPLLIFSQWNKKRTRRNTGWREAFRPPRLNYWNVLLIIAAIFLTQVLMGIVYHEAVHQLRPDIHDSLPDDFSGAMDVLTDDWPSLLFWLFSGALSYFVGGYVAAKLPNRKCPSPYRHALAGSMVINLLGITAVALTASGDGDGDSFSEEIIGQMLLMCAPFFLLSVLGAWVGVRKRGNGVVSAQEQMPLPSGRNKKVNGRGRFRRGRGKGARKSITSGAEHQAAQPAPEIPEQQRKAIFGIPVRRFVALSFGTLLVALVGVMAWRYADRPTARAVSCPKPPVKAALNHWPVTFASPAELCHDYASVDARLVGDKETYSHSQEEWERGLTAHAGDEIYVVIYINNGAADNAEEINPGFGIARGVRLTTEVDGERAATHYVNVQFAGDNTNTVVNRKRINTAPNERLEVVPKSGAIFNYTATEILADGLDVGNNVILVGDFLPKWEDSRFVRFRLKVTS